MILLLHALSGSILRAVAFLVLHVVLVVAVLIGTVEFVLQPLDLLDPAFLVLVLDEACAQSFHPGISLLYWGDRLEIELRAITQLERKEELVRHYSPDESVS